jgi:hypothetical protein
MVVIITIKKLSGIKTESGDIVWFESLGSFLDFFSEFCYLKEEIFVLFGIEE